jgi:S-adenosylmethionine:tRNA ribosyltransferase-isomerase
MDLAAHLDPGDLLVVNRSATLPASLPAHGRMGAFLLNLSTDYGGGIWLAEPRPSAGSPGPLPLDPGETVTAAGIPVTMIAPYPGISRLWFIRFRGDPQDAMVRAGTPIRYGYVSAPPALDSYQTILSCEPGSAEMPSAGRPFTRRVLDRLQVRGVRIAHIVLHTGVSSLEVESERVEDQALYPEPFRVPADTAEIVNRTRESGGRVIAVGTTVVRALESAAQGGLVRPTAGFTRLFVHPGRGVRVVDGLLTGLHDPVTSHLAMLYTIGSRRFIRAAYTEALAAGYLWHEFGDSHLILPGSEKSPAA